MSFDAVLWAVRSAPIADAVEWAVLVAMAEAADQDGCNSYQSRQTIGAMIKVDAKTVGRRQGAMEKRGLLGRGDQSAASHIPADVRPVVWDLMIPYGWFPDVDKTNAYRALKGRAPLTPESRPDLKAAPEKKRRADIGVLRPERRKGAGTHSPTVNAGTNSPAVPFSPATQGLSDPNEGTDSPTTQSLTQPNNPVPVELTLVPPPAAEQKPKTTSRRKTTVPDGWDPLANPKLRDWAKTSGAPSPQWAQAETRRFLDWTLANGRTYVDWDAAWRNWIGKAVNDLQSHPRGQRAAAGGSYFPGQGMFS